MSDKLSIQELKDNKVDNLNISDNNIGDEGAFKLADALKANTSLTALHLSSNNIGDEGATKLFEALKSNSSLTVLTLHSNKIGTEGAISLSEALKSNTSLAALFLSCNELLFHSISLNTGNNIGTEGAIKLSEALKSNSSLAMLYISDNNIGEEGATKLFEVISSKPSLISLDISGNQITSDLMKRFRETIQQNREINFKTWGEIQDFIRNKNFEQLNTLDSKHAIDWNNLIRGLSADGDTILHSAAKSNDVKMMEFVLQKISPNTKKIMLTMTNKQRQLPSDLLTVWAPSIHSLFPLKFRQVVKAVLMLGAKRQDGTPYYPQTHFYKLPKDVLFIILKYAV